MENPRRTVQLWDRLVKDAQEIQGFRDVRKYPVHRAADAERFLADLPDLQLPACLLVCGMRQREVLGNQRQRTIRWSAIVIVADESGAGMDLAANLADEFEDVMLDREISDLDQWVRGSGETAPILADPHYAVYEIGFTTLQGAAL